MSLLFHESGIVYPLLIISYILIFKSGSIKQKLKRWDIYLPLLPVAVYFIARLASHSHWLSGDYSYSLVNLPFNIVGNLFGYSLLVLLGPLSLSIYTLLRETLRENIIIAIVIVPLILGILYFVYKYTSKYFDSNEKKVIAFGFAFFAIALIPFLGLGNITSRYSYLASMGLIFVLIIFAKKAYLYLRSLDKNIAIGIAILFSLLFITFQVIQVQQTYYNWNEAGNKVQKFFLSINELYENQWASPTAEFHFVDLPIRVGEAWVFPVGINDALWFAIQNENAKIFIHPNMEEALKASGSRLDSPVLIFSPDGSLMTPLEATGGAKLIIDPALD